VSRHARYSKEELRRRVAELDPWFHNLDLNGVKTAPEHFLGDYPGKLWGHLSGVLPADLSGQTVLDIGCNAGFYSIAAIERGAARVVGIDTDERYLAQARLAAEVAGVDRALELRRLSVYQVGELGEKFDLVLFMGVLYHLRHPLLALDLVSEHVFGGLLLFQSMQRGSTERLELEPDYAFEERDVFERAGYPVMHFVERRYAGDPTNWWIPNRACVEAMLRSSGLRVVANPLDEFYLCLRDEEGDRWSTR
jgi:tRNA (mo5U34)-methyltransferase